MNQTYKKIVNNFDTPVFIYSESIIKTNIKRIKDAIKNAGLEKRVNIYVAYFANSNPQLFRSISNEGAGISIQSVEELHHLESFGLNKSKIIVSPTVLSDTDLKYFLSKKLQLNVALLEELEYAAQRNSNVGIRIDVSPKQNQRTGLKIKEFEKLNKTCERFNIKLHGIHIYPGTSSNVNKLLKYAKNVFKFYKRYFSEVKEINLGGGFAFNYKSEEPKFKHFRWEKYFLKLARLIKKYNIPEYVQISIEPGRDILADSGEFLIRINRTVKHGSVQQAYTDGSYVFMPSAWIKKRKHNCRFFDSNFNEISDRRGKVQISGCTTLSKDYLFPQLVKAPSELKKDFYIVVNDVGAYCATEHLEFLNKRPAAEVFIRENGVIELISKRGDFKDKIRYVLKKPKRIA